MTSWRGRFRGALLVLLVVFCHRSVFAQPAVSIGGVQPNRAYMALQPWESIDTASGNIILHFTDLTLPGKGGLSVERTFNNQPGGGRTQWQFSIDGLPMKVRLPNPFPSTPIQPGILGEQAWTATVYGADGSSQLTAFMQDPLVGDPESRRWMITTDFARFDAVERALYLPNGRVARYDENGRLWFARDRFDNTVLLEWSVDRTVLVVKQSNDSETREVQFLMNPQLELPLEMRFGQAVWTYDYPTSPELLEVVHLPEGLQWVYTYEGGLKRVTTPNLGTVTYNYGFKTFLKADGMLGSFWALTSRTADAKPGTGDWIFDYFNDGSRPAGLKVTLPSGRRVEYAYQRDTNSNLLAGSFLLNTVSLYEGLSVSPLQQETRTYVPLKAARPSQAWATKELSRRTVSRNGRDYVTQYTYPATEDTNFADYHRPMRITESAPGQSPRITDLFYKHLEDSNKNGSAYVLGLVTVRQVTVDGRSVLSGAMFSDQTGFQTSATAKGVVTTFEPDDHGNVRKVSQGNHWKQFSYRFGQMETMTSSEPGYFVGREIDSDGTLRSETRGTRTTMFAYDKLGRVTSVQPPGGTFPIVTTYAASSRVVARQNSVTTITLDGFGREIATLNGVTNVRTHTKYDAEGRITYRSLPFEGALDTAADIGTTYEFDLIGRVSKETTADGKFVRHIYDGSSDGPDTERVEDELGNHSTLYAKRTFGDPDGGWVTRLVDADLKTWRYDYVPSGEIEQVTGPDNVKRTWTYDPDRSRLTEENHPESGTIRYTAYNDQGLVAEKRDALNTVFVYDYDGNDRLKSVVATDATGQTRVATFGYELGTDNITVMSVDGSSTSFEYESATGRLSARNDSIDGKPPFRVEYTYDSSDNVKTIRYPSGRMVGYDYNNANQLTSAYRADPPNTSHASNIQYHPSGSVKSYTSGNGIVTTITYDPKRYWVNDVSIGPAALNAKFTYARDNVGNVQSITDARGGSQNQSFQYDALDRLTYASGPYGTQSFAYDAHGNRASNATGTYTYFPDTFRLQTMGNSSGTISMTYDANGNLKTGPQAEFWYTQSNQMSRSTVAGTTVDFGYDANNARNKRIQGGDSTYFIRGSAGELLTEWKNTSPTSTVKDYIYAAGALISVWTSNTQAPH
jgi:YD repeat-containing protein